jgi:Flp pilus assembly protein TadD
MGARPELSARARAWEGAVLRLTGQYAQAAALLEPLTRRYPRDRRLRFELGRTRMEQLRNREAAREFEAMLAVDPTDVSGHYSLMLCLQRLKQFTDARREETIYRLLSPDADASSGAQASAPDDRPLRVYRLEGPP